MTSRLSILLTLLAAFGLASCHADPVTEPDIRKCSHMNFRINAYLETAAALEAMPKGQAINLLKRWARTSHEAYFEEGADAKNWTGCDYEKEVITLCRMLFTPKPGESLRRPRIGGPILDIPIKPIGGTKSQDPHDNEDHTIIERTLDLIVLIDGTRSQVLLRKQAPT